MTERSLFGRTFRRRPAKCRRRSPYSRLALEPLEDRCMLTAPIVLDLGEGLRVRGVTRLASGERILVGDYLNPQTNQYEGRMFTVAANGSYFSTTTLGTLGGDGHTSAFGISPNGEYIVGSSFSLTSSTQGEGEAAIWRRDAPETAIGLGYVLDPQLPINYSLGAAVSNNGVAVGHSNGAFYPFSWEETIGIQALPRKRIQDLPEKEGVGGTGWGVSADGSLIVGFISTAENNEASFWANNEITFLSNQGMSGNARDISPNGLYIGGSTNFFDTFDTITQATVWVDSDLEVAANQTANDYQMLLLTDAAGNPFDGEVYAVSNNGYAVGKSNPYQPYGQQGFIWHSSFPGVRLFDEWLLAEYGITLPTPSLAINDVFFDGVNLNFAVQGSSYFVSVPAGGGGVDPPPCEGLLNSISGYVYLDANNNGVRDAGEAGLAGVTIILDGPVQRTVVTDPDGSYRFEDLPDGVYEIRQIQPAGYLDGQDTPGTPLLGSVENDRFYDLSLVCGAELVDYNFGERPNNSISGFVYLDLNNDGIKDPDEPGLSDVTITLTGPVNMTVVTAADGSYRFEELPDGVYTVIQTQPAGYLDGIDTPGTPLLGDVENDRFIDLDLSGNIHLIHYNFGERLIVPANSISGFVYLDLNNDGIKDPDEPGLSGVTITLTGPVQRTLLTDADGSYRFDDLPDGVYTVIQTQPAGYLDGIVTQGTPLLGRIENNRFVDLDLSDDVQLVDYNFGERPVMQGVNSISGLVYIDVNNNGQRDAPELGLPNVMISIIGPVQRSTLTGMDGTYHFADLPDGVYTVIQTQPAGFLDGIDTPGQPLLGSVEPNRFVDLDLSGGIQAMNYNFAERGLASPSKALFLASTPPPTPWRLAQVAGPDNARWFSLVSGEDAAVTVLADGGTTAIEFYTEGMYPVAESEHGSLQVPVTGGAGYLVRLTGEAEFAPVIQMSPLDRTGLRGFHHTARPLDVSGNGQIAPLDVLLIVNELNARRLIDDQGRFLVHPGIGSTLPYFDVNGDGRLTPADALAVINGLNARAAAEGEAYWADASNSPTGEEFTNPVDSPWHDPSLVDEDWSDVPRPSIEAIADELSLVRFQADHLDLDLLWDEILF